ncbi:DUF4382 domain-containing protein [Hydrogenivirga sp. 128-5-R1-1]|uniref:DUF4382 domain-containing protein n=1 Tax=Hydrogenivirga sp. 128-5-R1-1 TaxID=392423 RepID=UPI00015EF7DE|nr:DUF4382 domain-containing protein [Hydrogenivirga sp. 128-5-R1-1]EDP75648.1 hypothetical protein HG1285_16830 [Hydrogenivirga sp. 128-5-R1-1]
MGKKITLLSAIFAGGVLLQACGGGSGSTSSGTVALYATDDPLESAGRVEVQIKKVRMENTGTGAYCDVFSPQTPYPVDLTDLKNTLQLLDTANCPEGQYNRLVVVLEQSPVEVIYDRNKDGTPESYTCSLTDYTPQGSGQLPNRTECDNTAGECTVEVTGAVNILANQTNEVALDFELKDSEINFDNNNNCTVKFKVSPLHADGLETAKKNKKEEIKGTVSGLDPGANSFTLTTKAGMSFTVNYSNDNYDALLRLAQDKSLRVEVECSSFDVDNVTCTAEEIELKVEGTALNVDSTNRTLTVDLDGDQISVALDTNGEWEGDIKNNSYVEVEIIGYDSVNDKYIAEEIEHEMDKD